MDYIIYARRSSEDKKKQVQSIPNQLQWAENQANERDLKVIDTFTDIKTGTKPGREGFASMMEFVERHQGDLGVIVWKIDRLARNPIDEGAFKYAFMQKKIKHLIASDREFKEDDNQILMGLEFSAATQYSIELSRNVKRGMKLKVEKGWRPGYAPMGYLNDPSALQGNKVIHRDEARFPYIQKAWRLLLTGAYTVPQIQKILNEEWGTKNRMERPIGLSTLYQMFNNPFYTGLYRWKGELVKGAHEPMITLQEFDEAQVILGRKGIPRTRTHEHAYNGLIRCGECGCMITAEPPKRRMNKGNGRIRIYHYLRCTKKKPNWKCSQSYLIVKDLEKQIDGVLKTIEIPKAMAQWTLEMLRKNNKLRIKGLAAKRGELQKKYNDNEFMMESLLKKLLKGIVDDSTYQNSKIIFEKERSRLQGHLKNYEDEKDDWIAQVEKTFDFARDARSTFARADHKKRREIFALLGSNFILEDKKLVVELKKPFQVIQNGVNQTKSAIGSLEPLKNGLEKVKSSVLERVIPIWSG